MLDQADTDRVRFNTAPDVNRRIDENIEDSVRYYAGRDEAAVRRRIRELDEEWDIERVLEAMAASFSLTGIALTITADRKWLVVPAVVLSFLLLHAMQGWCPPVPVLRRLGVRTREEIDRERYALKAIIGDFARVTEERDRAGAALAAVTHGSDPEAVVA